MISVSIKRNKAGRICGFELIGHGEQDLVCPAVSLLALNTVNSIEALTDESLNCDHNPEGGYLKLELPHIIEGNHNPEADILLESFALGLRSVKETYNNQIELKDDKHD